LLVVVVLKEVASMGVVVVASLVDGVGEEAVEHHSSIQFVQQKQQQSMHSQQRLIDCQANPPRSLLAFDICCGNLHKPDYNSDQTVA